MKELKNWVFCCFQKKSILDIWLGSEYDYDTASVKKNPHLVVFQRKSSITHNLEQTNSCNVSSSNDLHKK